MPRQESVVTSDRSSASGAILKSHETPDFCAKDLAKSAHPPPGL